MYVHSDGRIVYLIRPTQPGDTYFGSDFTHYIYRELHKIYSFYYFWAMFVFLFFFSNKVRKIINYLLIQLKTCKVG